MATLKAILDAEGVDMVAAAFGPLSVIWQPPGKPPADEASRFVNRLRRQPGFQDTGCCGDLVFIRYRHQ